jgi:hypothetical protein
MGIYGIWKSEYLGFQDHPSHLLRIHILLNYHNPFYNYNKYFLPNWGLTPNQGSDAIIFLLGHVVSVAHAAKLFFCFYIILLPLSVWYFLYRVRPENCAYTILASVFTFNDFVLMGNDNFLSSIPVFFFFLGYWYRARNNSGIRARFISCILLVLLYYCHMLSFVCALLVIITVSLVEERRVRAIPKAISIALPSLFLFFVWVIKIVMQGATEESELRLLTLFPSWKLKIEGIMLGITPFKAPKFLEYTFLLFLIFSLSSSVVQSRRQQRNKIWFWAVVILLVSAVALPKHLIIFDPGERVVYLALLMASAIFSNRRMLNLCFISFLIVFALVVRIQEIKYITRASKVISYAIAPFKEASQDIKNRQKKILPLVLYPYVLDPAIHRSFEYYTLFNGGVNPHHIMSPNFTVRYRMRLLAPSLYYNTSPENLTKEMLETYDIIIVVGKQGYRGNELMVYLSSFGFKQVSGNTMTVVLRKP